PRRSSDLDVLPFEVTSFADTVTRYLDELTKLADAKRREIEERNRMVRDRVFEIAADPTKPYVSPKEEATPPFLNFAPLQNGRRRDRKSTRDFDRAAAAASPDKQAALDRAMMH